MTAVKARGFELTATVTFHAVGRDEIEGFAKKLSSAVGAVLQDFPQIDAFLVEPDLATGDINYGLRFAGVDPQYIDEMADEVLEKAVDLVAERDGDSPMEAEREESVLVLTR